MTIQKDAPLDEDKPFRDGKDRLAMIDAILLSLRQRSQRPSVLANIRSFERERVRALKQIEEEKDSSHV